MNIHQSLDPREIDARKSTAALQPDWIKPQFRDPIIPLNVDVRRFYAHFGVVPMPGHAIRLLLPAKALPA